MKPKAIHLPITLALAAMTLVPLTLLSLLGCGSGPGTGSLSTSGASSTIPDRVLNIEEALEAETGQHVRVQGALVATGTEIVLASVLLESYPPQAGGATIALEGMDIDSLVGLSSTSGTEGLAEVTWSDYWMMVGGVMRDGVLEVTDTPRKVAEAGDRTESRFSPVSEPISSADPVWWAFDLKNLAQVPLVLTFASGHKAEVVLAQDGVEKYRWSEGKVFTEAIEEVSVQPGSRVSFVLNDTLNVPPGSYELSAAIVGSPSFEGEGGAAEALPQLHMSITVD